MLVTWRDSDVEKIRGAQTSLMNQRLGRQKRLRAPLQDAQAVNLQFLPAHDSLCTGPDAMELQSWMILSMPPAPMSYARLPELSMHLRHIGLRALPREDKPDLLMGQTTWGCELAGHDYAVSWDWVEVSEAVIVLADRMGIVSNAVFDAHPLLGDGDRARHLQLNQLVYITPWQDRVRAALENLVPDGKMVDLTVPTRSLFERSSPRA